MWASLECCSGICKGHLTPNLWMRLILVKFYFKRFLQLPSFFGIMLNLARRPSIYISIFFQKCFVLLIHLNFKSHFDKVSSQSLKVFDLALTLNV